MKNRILILLIVLLPATAVMAQTKKEIAVTDIQLVHSDDYVTVSFNFHTGAKTTLSDYNLVITPVLQKANSSVQLPEIVVRGMRAKLSEERHRLSEKQQTFRQRPLYTENNRSVNYITTLPFESWMVGSQLIMNAVSIGCCSATDVEIGLIADNLLYAKPVQEIEIVQVPVEVPRYIPSPVKSTGERLAEQFSFVQPASQLEKARRTPSGGIFDYNMPLNLGKGLTPMKQNDVEHFIEGTRDGSITILFAQGSKQLDRSLGDNNKGLVELISAVRTLESSDDTQVIRIVIAGFASPEGALTFNERLAWDRAVTVKNFLLNNSSVRPDIVSVYNGSVNWGGLRELVAGSDLYDKQKVINIIDNIPIWDPYHKTGRLGELMRLHGGETYRYMYKNYFPKLRQAAFIKVYYDNK